MSDFIKCGERHMGFMTYPRCCDLPKGHTGLHSMRSGFIRIEFDESKTVAGIHAAAERARIHRAQKLKYGIIWTRFPTLAAAFENKPTDDPCWEELDKFIEAARTYDVTR